MPRPTDVQIWPLLGVRLTVSDVELRPVDDATALDLGRLAADGIHGTALPFETPWTRGTPIEVARNVYRYQSSVRASVTPDKWIFEFAARLDGTLIGVQSLSAEDFGTTRSVKTGSWLGSSYQGRGIGTLLRIAVLSFAFDALGASEVRTRAWADNAASNAVTRKLGYEPNGEVLADREGVATVSKRYKLSQATWRSRPADLRPHVHIEGAAAVRELLGVTD